MFCFVLFCFVLLMFLLLFFCFVNVLFLLKPCLYYWLLIIIELVCKFLHYNLEWYLCTELQIC